MKVTIHNSALYLFVILFFR